MCFYGQNMVACYMFLGYPPDTVEEGATSLWILNFTEKILQTVSARARTAQCTANADRCGLFLLHFSQCELVMGADYRGLMFVRFNSRNFLFKAGREKPQYFFSVLRRKACIEPTDCTYRHARGSRITSVSL